MEHQTSHRFNDHHSRSLSSQRSLASVPSLNSSYSNPSPTISHSCLTPLKSQSTSYTSSLTLAGKFLYTGSSDREIRTLNRFQLDPQQYPTTITGKGAVKSIA